MTPPITATGSNFIRDIVLDDLKTNKFQGRVHTRFPPEPNGYLHIGHAKSICLNFSLAQEFNGQTNLRFDDTNPEKEEQEYVDSIIDTLHWLGYQENRILYASDYFGQGSTSGLVKPILVHKAYAGDLSAEELRKYRGTSAPEPGTPSPWRDRSVEENLDLFRRMKEGEFPGRLAYPASQKSRWHRRIFNMRDPGDVPDSSGHAPSHWRRMVDLSDVMTLRARLARIRLEGITHSICTLEFEDHRPLYDWFVEQLGIYHPQQIEFDRLNLTYTLLSKRKLLQLVQEKHVRGWDDPRMPTLFVASAAAAIHLRRSEISVDRLAYRRPTASSSSDSWNTTYART